MGSDERIKHVVVLMLENRSFDHMLGFLDHDGLTPVTGLTNPRDPSDPDPDLCPAFALDGYDDLGHDPYHAYPDVMEQLTAMESGWTLPDDLTNQGFAWNYQERTGLDGGEVMGCYTRKLLPILYALACEYTVCARWFCSVPTLTGPNRLFAHAGTSDNVVVQAKRPYYNRTIFEALTAAPVKRSWRIYYGDIPQVVAYPKLWGHDGEPRFFHLGQFFKDVHDGGLKDYSFIEPVHFGSSSSSQHPRSRVLLGEQLIRDVYMAVAANNDAWESTLLLITYDEHGGFFDREAPPVGVPPAVPPYAGARDDKYGFGFDMLGPRVPAIVVSPYVKQAKVDMKVTYDHTSILATLRQIFDVSERFNDRVAQAKSVVPLLTEPTARAAIELPQVPPIPAGDLGPNEWANGFHADGTIRLNDLQEELMGLAQLVDEMAEPPSVDAPPLPQPPFQTPAEIDDFVASFRTRQLDRM